MAGMKIAPLALLLLAAATSSASARADFDADFTGATLRLDYVHSGHATLELFSLVRARVEGPWPGSRTRLLDDSGLGRYLFEVVDCATSRPLYSRGFASIFGEYETTEPAKLNLSAALEEAVRFPEPRRPVQVRIRKRDARQQFREVWSVEVDPASRFVERGFALPGGAFEVDGAAPIGDSAQRVDLLLLGDGYAAEEAAKFRADAEKAAGALFAVEPYRSRKDDFNVRAVFSPARESGISNPRRAVFRDSPLGVAFNTFDSDRYALTFRDRAWRDVAAAAPYDAVIILLNTRKYGGGGIYELYCSAAIDSAEAGYLVIHEFGHSFAGLADEYYTSPVSYTDFTAPDVEPWEPNVTVLRDPARLKWKDLVRPGTALPTPWNKDEYDTFSRAAQKRRAELLAGGAPEEELEALYREERRGSTDLLKAHLGVVGAFEGALYEPRGFYRPAGNCTMFTRDEVGFCAVCSRAIDAAIDRHTTR